MSTEEVPKASRKRPHEDIEVEVKPEVKTEIKAEIKVEEDEEDLVRKKNTFIQLIDSVRTSFHHTGESRDRAQASLDREPEEQERHEHAVSLPRHHRPQRPRLRLREALLRLTLQDQRLRMPRLRKVLPGWPTRFSYLTEETGF